MNASKLKGDSCVFPARQPRVHEVDLPGTNAHSARPWVNLPLVQVQCPICPAPEGWATSSRVREGTLSLRLSTCGLGLGFPRPSQGVCDVTNTVAVMLGRYSAFFPSRSQGHRGVPQRQLGRRPWQMQITAICLKNDCILENTAVSHRMCYSH